MTIHPNKKHPHYIKDTNVLNALDSKKKINPEIGTNSAPINIIPGMALALPNTFVNTHNARKVIPKAKIHARIPKVYPTPRKLH